MKVLKDVKYGEYPENTLDIYLPETESFRVFLYFHGGGLNSGDKRFSAESAEYLTNAGIALVSANYRMYPTAKYPDFVTDAAKAADFVLSELPEYGKCLSFYLGGSSAGGYLSMMLCFAPQFLGAFSRKPEDFDGYLHDAGQPTCHFNVLRERGLDPRRVIADETSPIYYVGTAESYPVMRFIVSDNDMKNRYEQTELMLSTLRHFGYDQSKISLRIMHGKHCEYVGKKTENGNSVLSGLIKEFVCGENQ